MSGSAEVGEAFARIVRFEREGNIAGLIQELTSDVQGRGKYSIPRADAALALGRLRDPRAIPHLAGLLQDPEEIVRMSALDALGRLRAKESDALTKALEDGSPVVRMAAAEALGRTGCRDAIPQLREVLATDPNAEVRLHTVESLVLLGDKQSRDRVPEVLKAVGWRVRGHSPWKRLGKVVEAGEPLTPWVDAG